MSLRTNKQMMLPALLIGIAGLAIAPMTAAQDALGTGDALGSGNALDANPERGSGGSNPLSRNWSAEIAYRNAIVTGNVGGGREFRGSVGYSGIGDFRGALGSDLVYNFERETFYSGLAARNIRGIEATALQLQGGLSGQRGGPAGLSGGLIINRPGSGTISSQITQPGSAPNRINDLMAFDQVNNTLRSTSAYTVRDAMRPRIVGAATDGTNQLLLTASPLGGVDALSPLDPSLVSGRSFDPDQFNFDPRIAIPGFREQAIRDRALLDEIEIAEDIAQRMPTHNRILKDLREQAVRRGLLSEEDIAPEADRSRTPGQPQPDGQGSRPGSPSGGSSGMGFPGIDDAVPGSTRNQDRPTGEGDGQDATLDELDRLLRGFSSELVSDPAAGLGPEGRGGSPLDGPPELGPTRLDRTEDPTRRDPGSVDEALNQQTMDRMIELLRAQRTNIDRIAPTDDNSLYAQHMRAGERLLSEGMWFIAEERFVAALSGKPGDAMAAIGRVHAQIGAGLYLSASTNLADLLRAYPELSTVRYEEKLLPGAERLERIRVQLRARSVDDNANARNAGFLLAYLGYQTERPGDIREGFAVVKRVDAALGNDADPLMDVLVELWTESDSPEADQAPDSEP